MDTALLRAFLTVADERHFGRAAAHLNLAPSTLSQQVSKLERLTGATLFDRHPVALTAAGERLLPAAQEAVRAADAAARRIGEIRAQPNSELRVGILSHGGGPRMAHLIRTYRARHPEVHVTLVSLAFSAMTSALLDGLVDVAFVRPSLDDPRFEEYPVLTEQRYAILPGYDDRAHLPTLSLADLDRDTFLTPSKTAPARYAAFLHLLDDRNDDGPRTVDTRCDHAEEFLAAVAAGLGVATTVTSFTHHYPWPDIAYVPVRDAKPASTTAILSAGDNRPHVQGFASLLVG